MKRILLILVFTIGFLLKVDAQCSPNSLFTGIGLPGVFPPPFATQGLSMFGINDGSVGVLYSQTLTLVVLEDTIMDVSSLLPTSIISAMNAAGISTIMSLNVNHATFDVQGLPSGITYQCDISNCQYLSGIDGCIQLTGIPAIGGTFSVPVDMIVNIQIPAITDPVFGTVIFPATALDMPAFSVQTYDLFISNETAVHENHNTFNMFPNPTSDIATLFLQDYSDVIVYNTLGKEVISLKNIDGNIVLNKEYLGSGLFFINISSENNNRIIKLIIK